MVVIFKTGAGRIVISYRLALAAQNTMNTIMMSMSMVMVVIKMMTMMVVIEMMMRMKYTEVR